MHFLCGAASSRHQLNKPTLLFSQVWEQNREEKWKQDAAASSSGGKMASLFNSWTPYSLSSMFKYSIKVFLPKSFSRSICSPPFLTPPPPPPPALEPYHYKAAARSCSQSAWAPLDTGANGTEMDDNNQVQLTEGSWSPSHLEIKSASSALKHTAWNLNQQRVKSFVLQSVTWRLKEIVRRRSRTSGGSIGKIK